VAERLASVVRAQLTISD